MSEQKIYCNEISEPNLEYSPLIEDRNRFSYRKKTVIWAINNESKVRYVIKSTGKGKLRSYDIDDIYQDIICYLASAEDYDINKAIERRKSDHIATLQELTLHLAKNCTQRFMANQQKEYLNRVIDNDNDGYNPADIELLTAKEKTDIENLVIADVCMDNTEKRYIYGTDLYLYLYIKVICYINNIETSRLRVLTDELGIDSDKIEALQDVKATETIKEFARAIESSGYVESANELRKYVYSSDKIDKAISLALSIK